MLAILNGTSRTPSCWAVRTTRWGVTNGRGADGSACPARGPDRGPERRKRQARLEGARLSCVHESRRHALRTDPTPQLPRDSRAQSTGRRGEAFVTEQFERHDWIVMRNGPGVDFGVDLAAFKRSDDRSVLPYALSVQVKAVTRAEPRRGGGVAVRVRPSTLASWLWSSTPTVCVVYEITTNRMWWSVPVVSETLAFDRAVKSRTLHLEKTLDSEEEWRALDGTVADLWRYHDGAGALADVPLLLQVLTDVALSTDLWTNVGDTADAIYHAAAVYVFRTVASLNALAGRTGSESFIGLAATTDDQVALSDSKTVVRRADEVLGVIYGTELKPRLPIFGRGIWQERTRAHRRNSSTTAAIQNARARYQIRPRLNARRCNWDPASHHRPGPGERAKGGPVYADREGRFRRIPLRPRSRQPGSAPTRPQCIHGRWGALWGLLSNGWRGATESRSGGFHLDALAIMATAYLVERSEQVARRPRSGCEP